MSDTSEQYSFERALGIITAWDEMRFGDDANVGGDKDTPPKARTKFTVDDIYILLRRLKNFIDPSSIERIESIVTKHVNDKDNPHGVNIEQLVTSVMNELYLDWLRYTNRTKYDNAYTEEELRELLPSEQFLKVLYQQITIADVDTALQGTSVDEVTNVYDVAQMIKQHNDDKNAHAALFEYLFPGAVHTYAPTLGLIAATGKTEELIVHRESELSYMGSDGCMHKEVPNSLPVDWSTGRPAYPFFGPTTNHCTHGSVLTDEVYTLVNTTISTNENIPSILVDEKAFKVACTDTDTPMIHKFTYTVPQELVENHTTLCVSIFARTGTLDNIGINVHTGVPNEFHCWHYNLSNQKTYCIPEKMAENIFADISTTPNGYSRCTYICPVDVSKNMIVEIYLLDIFDGDLTFTGKDTLYVDMTGLQIEFDTDTPSPYKSTTGEAVSEDGTIVYLNVDHAYSWYNQFQGGFVFEASTIKDTPLLTEPRYVFDLVYGENEFTSLAAFYPSVHYGHLNDFFANAIGANVLTYLNPPVASLFEKYGMGFANSGRVQPITGDTIIVDKTKTLFTMGNSTEIVTKELDGDISDVATNVTRLYIGCKGPGTAFFNGYISEFIYYPSVVTPDHLRFYIKG